MGLMLAGDFGILISAVCFGSLCCQVRMGVEDFQVGKAVSCQATRTGSRANMVVLAALVCQ